MSFFCFIRRKLLSLHITILPNKPMRKFLLLLLSATLSTACVDKDYDLKDVDTDNVTIGDDESEFRIPLAQVLVSMKEIADNGTDIREIFREADVWLPSPLPGNLNRVDLQELQTSQSAVNTLLDALEAQMLTDDSKIDAVAEELCKEEYFDTFRDLLTLPAGTAPETFIPVFISAFRGDEALRDLLGAEVKNVARTYLTTLDVEPIVYEVGHIDISDDVVDMLSDNLDPKTTANPKNTLHLEGMIANRLPVSLHIDPVFDPTQITFDVDIEAHTLENAIPSTRLFADDLRQIVGGITIRIPVTMHYYYPGTNNFPEDSEHPVVIDLRLVKHGGLKLNI